VDVARQAMEQASVVVGEINTRMPFTFGDTFVPISEFDFLIRATEPILYINRWSVDEVFDGVAANLASVIEDGTCMAFSVGPLFEALSRHLMSKRHLGVHSPIFTDGLMDLVRGGAVTNRKKEIWRGKSLSSYAVGTPELMAWLDRNPLVEFQAVDKVYEPTQIGRNRRFVAIFVARKVDLSGRIALHGSRGNVAAEPGEAMDLLNGAEISEGGRTICALPSRNRQGWPNIRVSVEEFPYLFTLWQSVDMVVTEYGVASLAGRTVRERAQALIDIAHPDDRRRLVEQAKEERILYRDQIFIEESACIYPAHIGAKQTFDGGLEVSFRAIKPSDEEEMRHLFYRFSDDGVYSRYFTSIKAMPHRKMQEYVNVDCNQIMSIVGLTGKPGKERIIGEARFTRYRGRPFADVAFIVDEEYQNRGIATFMYRMLIRLARERGLKGFTADVLVSNRAMMKVLEKGDLPITSKMERDFLKVTMPFEEA
jgi:RimJ/RimL family protein N-acetyltransferase